MWQVSGDRWQVTDDRWQVTYDTWHMTHSVGWIFSHNFSSLAFPVWDWQYLEDIGTQGWVNESMNELINESVTQVIVEQPRLHRVC